MISQLQIKKLQQTIDKQLQSSPLNKKMIASQIYNEKNQKPSKINFIMQTSSTPHPQLNTKNNKIQSFKKQNKKQIKQISILPRKNQEEKKAQQRLFLISQNKTLKDQTLNLIQQLKGLLTQIKPKKYGINLSNEQQSAQQKIKKITIAKQLTKITQLQSKISYQKRQLINVYDDQNITSQEAQIKILENEVQKLQKQKKGIMNVLKQQNKGIQQIQMTPEFREKFNKTKDQLQKIKQECKSLQNKTLQNQRLLRKKHEKAVGQHSKIKKLQKMIKQNQQKIKKGKQNEKVVTLEMIAQIQEQIGQLESQRQGSEKSWSTKLANIEAQLQTRKLQEQRKELILKDKQKQVRLNDLRIKQLKKFIMSQMGEKRKVSISGDEGSGGNAVQGQKVVGRKRNIQYLEGKQKINESNGEDN